MYVLYNMLYTHYNMLCWKSQQILHLQLRVQYHTTLVTCSNVVVAVAWHQHNTKIPNHSCIVLVYAMNYCKSVPIININA